MIVETTPLVLVLQNFRKRVLVRMFGSDEQPVDPTVLDLQVQRLDGTVVLEDSYTTPPLGGTRIERADVGQYYVTWGPDETVTAGCKFLFVWAAIGPDGTEEQQSVQTVEVVSAATIDCVREFRGQIDKGVKDVSVDPADFCPLGYTDGMLLEYLRGGMTLINSYQPYPTWCSLEDFVRGPAACFRQTLFDAGLVVGINAQTLFAIDSDVESYSDQGNSLVLNHAPKLAAFSQALTTRLDTLIPRMKLHFVRVGAVKTEAGPNFRLQTLVQMSPNGATFRNVFTR